MITKWQMYWLTRLDGINDMLGTSYILIIIALIIVSIIIGIGYSSIGTPDELFIKWLKIWKWLIIAFFINSLGYLVPNTKEMAAILIIPKITDAIDKNAELQKIPQNIIQLANEWIEELKPKKDKNYGK